VPYLKRAVAACAVVLLVSQPAAAHVPGLSEARGEGGWVAGLLAISVALYAAGFARLWGRISHRSLHGRRALAFAAGIAMLALLLFGPIDRGAADSFALHMVQHEGLMLIAAPLLVLGHGLPLMLWGLPHRLRLRVAALTRSDGLRTPWRWLTAPLSAWLLHAAALWIWHAPAFFNAALQDPVLHEWQHATFLATALLFWHALLRRGTRNAQGLAVVYLFTTTIHTGILGALLTFARSPLYAPLDHGLIAFHALTPIEDQQLGGLIMWVPGALVYVGMGLWMAARWIGTERLETTPAR
jgi:putative membrane protein